MEKIQVIINPSSGDENYLEIRNRLKRIFHKKKIKSSFYETKGNDNFHDIIKESVKNDYKKVVLSGGDGTISEFVNGIAELEKRPEIILLPSGTTNNFARTISSDKTENEVLQALEEDRLVKKKVDLGYINNQYFISSIALGMLPTVGWKTDKELKAELGSFAYLLEGFKLMKEEEQKSFDLKIELEEESIVIEDVFLFIVALSNSIFGIKTFFDKAEINDGNLHFFALKKSGVLPELSSLVKQITKKEDKDDEFRITGDFKKARIESNTELPFLMDGEKGLSFPAEIEVLANELTFLVPKE
ncbi:MAG: YegS/Rv2252/BmrU family lipid kinase [Atopostipes sp.]|nr:YegS/Rv2252/BmrU family lipid kinase [Atopostipes sp.]